MNVINHQTITLDLQRPNISVIYAKQDDKLSRIVSISLRSGGVEWEPGDNASFAIQFQKPDGKRGIYEKLPGDKAAVVSNGSVLTATLVPQVFTAAGTVRCSIAMFTPDNEMRLQTFAFMIQVEASETPGGMVSKDYYNMPTLSSLSASIGDLTKLLTGENGNLVDAINSLPQYRPVGDPHDFGGYIANIQDDGFYAIYDADFMMDNYWHDWNDRPAEGRFALVVSQFSPDENIQIAASQMEHGTLYIRFVSRIANQNGSYPVSRDWVKMATSSDIVTAVEKLPQYRPVTDPTPFASVLANLVNDGTYTIYDADFMFEHGWQDWQDRPAEGDFALIVSQFSPNENIQIAVSAQPDGAVYSRIVSRSVDEYGNHVVVRPWKQIAGGARAFVQDTEPENPKDGDEWFVPIEGDADPFVTETQMRDYVSETVPDWAQQQTKPKYTADEVGAQPKGDYVLRNELPTTGGKTWRKIAEHTLEEDTTASTYFAVTEDLDGNPFNVKEFLVIVKVVSTASPNFNLLASASGNNTNYAAMNMPMKNGRHIAVHGEIIGDNTLKSVFTLNMGVAGYQGNLTVVELTEDITGFTVIYGGAGISAGTTYAIWGVDK